MNWLYTWDILYRYQDPFNSQHRFNQALVYEVEGKLEVGSELYYYSTQTRNDGSIGKGYWLAGSWQKKYGRIFDLP